MIAKVMMRMSGVAGRTGLALAGALAAELAPTVEIARAQTPAATPTQIEERYGCILCHADLRRAFVLGAHAERGIRCHDCHGGNPRAFGAAAAHSGNYVGAPDKWRTVRICSSCHSDPNQMRQYGLKADQLVEFRTSRHGALLLEQRNPDAPTCTDCHDAHAILPPQDARSSVHPTNIPRTCARCHEDAALMAKYGLPTDVAEAHRLSAHGAALFEERNFAAPTCVDCHGFHAALPPGVTEIANVCGRCHVPSRRAFYAGPHGRAALAGKLPGCLACHSNHGTERVAAREIAATCRRCHERDGRAAAMGLEIQEKVLRATADLEATRVAIEELRRRGESVIDARFRYQTALTDYLQIAHAQHALDLTRLEDLGRRVGSISRDLRTSAEASAEQRWEHKLLLVPIWFLALSGIALAWFKLRSLRGESG